MTLTPPSTPRESCQLRRHVSGCIVCQTSKEHGPIRQLSTALPYHWRAGPWSSSQLDPEDWCHACSNAISDFWCVLCVPHCVRDGGEKTKTDPSSCRAAAGRTLSLVLLSTPVFLCCSANMVGGLLKLKRRDTRTWCVAPGNAHPLLDRLNEMQMPLCFADQWSRPPDLWPVDPLLALASTLCLPQLMAPWCVLLLRSWWRFQFKMGAEVAFEARRPPMSRICMGHGRSSLGF